MRVAGSRPQGPVGQVSRGLGARAPGLGARPTRPGAFSPQKPPNPSNHDFSRRGCRLKRLLRRWGPGGKRRRDTPPTPPPPRGCRKKGRGETPSPSYGLLSVGYMRLAERRGHTLGPWGYFSTESCRGATVPKEGACIH